MVQEEHSQVALSVLKIEIILASTFYEIFYIVFDLHVLAWYMQKYTKKKKKSKKDSENGLKIVFLGNIHYTNVAVS